MIDLQVQLIIYKRQSMQKQEKPMSSNLLKPKQRLMPLNNKQNSNNIFKRLNVMDGHTSSQERRPPRSLKNIQTEITSQNSIINVNALLQKSKAEQSSQSKKQQEVETVKIKGEPTEQLPFRQAIETQIQNDVQDYLHEARRRNKKKRMLHKKQSRRFSNPDDFSKFKNF